MKKFSLLIAATLLLTTSCSHPNPRLYKSFSQPEALIDSSSEQVTFALYGEENLSEIASWIEKDRPSEATLLCIEDDNYCKVAGNLLKANGIKLDILPSSNGHSYVKLDYNKVIARDCSPEFKSNHYNYMNLNHPAFGCANSANILRMVDIAQVVNPVLSSPTDAAHAAKAMGKMNESSN